MKRQSLTLAVALLVAACSSESRGLGESLDDDQGKTDSPRAGCARDADCASGFLCVRAQCIFVGDDDGEGGAPEPPPAGERRISFPSVPVPGDAFVYVAIPGGKALARVRMDDTLAVVYAIGGVDPCCAAP